MFAAKSNGLSNVERTAPAPKDKEESMLLILPISSTALEDANAVTAIVEQHGRFLSLTR
jgi:hypothetical protein